jgi:hypothetical protein
VAALRAAQRVSAQLITPGTPTTSLRSEEHGARGPTVSRATLLLAVIALEAEADAGDAESSKRLAAPAYVDSAA